MRRWLESNKIFFETIAAICLAIMAIVLSIQDIQMKKVEISTYDYSYQPDIHVRHESAYDSVTSTQQDNINIYNLGGKASNIQVDVSHLLLIEAGPDYSNSIKKDFLLINSFNQIDDTKHYSGLIRTIQGINSKQNVDKLKIDLQNEALKRSLSYISIQELFVVKVSFIDYKGEAKDLGYIGSSGEFYLESTSLDIFKNRHTYFLNNQTIDLNNYNCIEVLNIFYNP